MRRPSASKLLRYFFAHTRSTERDHGQRNRSPLSYFAVGMFEFLRRSEEACVIIADTEIHVAISSNDLMQSLASLPYRYRFVKNEGFQRNREGIPAPQHA